MGWKIVEVVTGEHLNFFLDNLVILKENNKISIPIKDIDVLIIDNQRTKITTRLISELSSSNILTIICDSYHKPQSYIVPIYGNYNTLKIFESQLNWNHKFKSDLWTKIVKQKIYNQFLFIKNILKNDIRSEMILDFMNQIKEYDITNREGHASKVYWNTLFGLDFTRDQDNYINSLLNYGYTVLNGYISRSIIKKGLDPRISLFHKSYHNHFALSSDLIEPFRVIVDIEVYKIWKTNENNIVKHKEALLNLFNKKIMINNKLHYINNAIDIFIDSVVSQSNLPIFDFFYEL